MDFMKNLTPTQRSTLKKGILLAAGLVVVLVVVLHLAGGRHPLAPPAIPVAVARVMRTDLARAVEFDAEFRPYLEIELHPKVAGFVKEMRVDIGDQVQAGELLATLEVPELQDDIARAQAVEKRSESEIQLAQAGYDAAHLVYTRLAGVKQARPELVAQQDIDDANAKDLAAAAALEAARHAAQVAKSDVDKLKDIDSYTRITAPFTGVITKREADPGALIPDGRTTSQTMPMLRLSENDRLRLDFPVSVSYVAQIHVGQPVRIHIQSMDKDLTGTVSRFERKVDTATRTMIVEVEVPNPDLTLVPGMYASVAVELERHNKTLAVPLGAVSRQATATVYVVDPQNKIQERTVTLGLETPTLVEILRGLNEGDRVMLGSRTQVQPGQTVEPKLADLAAN
jgi:RND family efflux transporter MFP subunit